MKEKTNCTVLIVDDSPEDRYIFSSYLQQSTDCIYTVLEAEDLQSGMRVIGQVRVDCVLLDHELPDGHGLEFIETLRDANQNVTVPVVVVTGHGSEHVAVDAMKAGAIDYLVKDCVSPESLLRVTQNALARLNTLNGLAKQTRERARVEGELRESESHFRLLVSSVSDYAIVMLSLEGIISTWNQGARKIFGYHDQDMIGQHVACLVQESGGQQNATDAQLAQASREHRCESEQMLRRRDGSSFYALTVLAPLVDALGQHKGYSWVVRDLTERHGSRTAMQITPPTGGAQVSEAALALRGPATALLRIVGEMQQLAQTEHAQVPPWLEARLAELSGQAAGLAERIDALSSGGGERTSLGSLRHG